MGFLTVLILAGALALSCFIVGNLPLSFSFSSECFPFRLMVRINAIRH